MKNEKSITELKTEQTKLIVEIKDLKRKLKLVEKQIFQKTEDVKEKNKFFKRN